MVEEVGCAPTMSKDGGVTDRCSNYCAIPQGSYNQFTPQYIDVSRFQLMPATPRPLPRLPQVNILLNFAFIFLNLFVFPNRQYNNAFRNVLLYIFVNLKYLYYA